MWEMRGMDSATSPGPTPAPQEARAASASEQAQADKVAAASREAQHVWTAQNKEAPSTTLQEMLKEARTKAEQEREQFKFKRNTRYGDAPLEAYARLARAKNHADVNAAAGFARRRMVQLKSNLRQDSDNSSRIRAAMQQLQKVIVRSGRKKRDLTQEEITGQQMERRAEEKQRREELRLSTEQLRRKAMRVIREQGYLSEASISDRLAAQSDAARRQGEPLAPVQASAGTSISPTLAAEQYTAMANLAPSPDLATFTMEA